MSLVWRQAPALLVFSFLANLLLFSAVHGLQVYDRVLPSGALDTLDVADGRDAGRHPKKILVPGRFERRPGFRHSSSERAKPAQKVKRLVQPTFPPRCAPCSGAFLGIGLISGVLNVLFLTVALFMLTVYDRVVPSRSLPTLVALAVLAIGLYLFQAIFDVLRGRALVRTAPRSTRR